MAGMAEVEIAPVFKETLIVLGATAAVIPIFYRLKLSPVIGFILIGLGLGPFGLGALADTFPWLSTVTITDKEELRPVAEWGVVLLLLTIGLELSFERLKIMSRLIFGLGSLQVILSTAAITAALALCGVKPAEALVIGVALAQSSTAVLVQTLAQERKLRAPVGRTSFSVLLFQDIAAAPILFALGAIAVSRGADMFGAFGGALAQAAIAVAVLIALGRFALPPFFRSVARTQSPELFLAACLLVIIGTGIVASLAGISAAIGALIAGILLAETEYRRQIEVLIEPFKGLFVGVFLILAGMGIDLRAAFADPIVVLGGAAALLLVKAAIMYGLGRLFRLPKPTAMGAALVLAPGGEFAFIILAAAASLVSPPALQASLTVVALTMVLIPFLSRLGDRVADSMNARRKIEPDLLPPEPQDEAPRAVIAGYGRVGRLVGEMLEEHKVPYLALDADPDVVRAARRDKKPVFYGDASNLAMLERLGLARMRALIVTMEAPDRIEAVVETARTARRDLLIVARARDAVHAGRLYKLGANDVAPETIEASLQLSEAVLVDLGVPMGPVIASIHEKRAQFRSEVMRLAPDAHVPARHRRRLREMFLKSGEHERSE